MIYLENGIKKFESNFSKSAGMLYIIFQAFLFSSMGIFIKSAKPMQSFELVFYRSILTLIPNFFVLRHYKINPYRSPKDKFFLLFISRAVFGFLGMSMMFYALSISSIAEVITISFISPGN